MPHPEVERDVETKLDLISLRAKKEPAYRFESLAHLLNEGFLEQCYRGLGRNKAAGVDGISWQEYGEKLDENLKGLVVRLEERNGPDRYRHDGCISPRMNTLSAHWGYRCRKTRWWVKE